MQDRCDQLHSLSSQIPSYTSWNMQSLVDVFNRFREVILELVQSHEYINYKWLAEYCPRLEGKIHVMLSEPEMDKQSRIYNIVTFEIQCAIDVILGRLGCQTSDDWHRMITPTEIDEKEGSDEACRTRSQPQCQNL